LHLRDYEGKMADPPLGISSPYPASEDLDLHLQMLLQEQPSVLAILAGDAEVADRAQGYFRMNGVTDNVIVTSSLQESTRIGDYDVEIHQLTLQKKGDQKADGSHESTGDVVTTPVVYVGNWKDGTHMPADLMEQLQDLLDRVKKPDKDGSRNRLPAAHCREGVGRAGQLLCARTIRKLVTSRAACSAYVISRISMTV
jgi:protein tyrosine phosphatase